jgi:hypothetical protein
MSQKRNDQDERTGLFYPVREFPSDEFWKDCNCTQSCQRCDSLARDSMRNRPRFRIFFNIGSKISHGIFRRSFSSWEGLALFFSNGKVLYTDKLKTL